ncbi:MAG TPA: outer-membrane lipoprotein carrier protein LolA [Gemmatimonadales bacterium]|nr:outer-membrane lipoprotein carrier protein LolA [Gemmatimonadales bacterium]
MIRARLAAAALLLAAAPLRAQDGIAVVRRAARAYAALPAFQADFQQVIADPMIGTYTSRGRLVQAGTSRLAMRFTDPKGDAIVMDGKWSWVYTPSTTPGQVLRFPIRGGDGFGPNVVGWLLDRPAERYDVRYVRTDTTDGVATDVVALGPKSPEMPFTEATLWLARSDALPRRLEIVERSGTRRTLILSHLRTAPKVGAATFRFDVPSGVRIVDQD